METPFIYLDECPKHGIYMRDVCWVCAVEHYLTATKRTREPLHFVGASEIDPALIRMAEDYYKRKVQNV